MSYLTDSVFSCKRPKQARSSQLVKDVLAAATQVLLSEGAQRFTTSRVAEVAGVSVGSLYQYFPNREAILFRLQMDEWQATLAAVVEILTDDRRVPLDRLRSAISAFLRSECDEAPIRLALAPSAPSFSEADAIFHYRRAVFRRILRYWRDVLPSLHPRRRLEALRLVMITVEAFGNRVAESRTPYDAADTYAQALGEMLCTYLAQLNEGSVAAKIPRHSSAVGDQGHSC